MTHFLLLNVHTPRVHVYSFHYEKRMEDTVEGYVEGFYVGERKIPSWTTSLQSPMGVVIYRQRWVTTRPASSSRYTQPAPQLFFSPEEEEDYGRKEGT